MCCQSLCGTSHSLLHLHRGLFVRRDDKRQRDPERGADSVGESHGSAGARADELADGRLVPGAVAPGMMRCALCNVREADPRRSKHGDGLVQPPRGHLYATAALVGRHFNTLRPSIGGQCASTLSLDVGGCTSYNDGMVDFRNEILDALRAKSKDLTQEQVLEAAGLSWDKTSLTRKLTGAQPLFAHEAVALAVVLGVKTAAVSRLVAMAKALGAEVGWSAMRPKVPGKRRAA